METAAEPLTAHSAPTSRGISAFGGSTAQASNAGYRMRFVVGSEVPIGTAQSATHRILVGPMEPPPAPISGGVTPFGQPERADYTFTSAGATEWTIELRRRAGGACAERVSQRTAGAASTVNGIWSGLSPGASYCWSARASDYRGPRTRSGEVTIPALPTFTAGPTAAPSAAPTPFDVDVRASTSTRATGTVSWASGDCADQQTLLGFDGSDVATIRGQVIPLSAHSVELWLRLRGASQTRSVVSALGGNVRLALENGALRYEVRTAAPSAGGEPTGLGSVITAAPLAVDRWLHVAATYGGGNLRLYVDAVNLGARAWGGDVVDGGLDLAFGAGGGAGFTGDLASAAVYGRALSAAEISSHRDQGASVELAAESGRVAAWHFAEAPGVQSIYDASGTHHAGTLGALHVAETSDPSRGPALPSSAMLAASGLDLATRLSGLTGGPTYCYRVVAATGAGTIASSPPRTFTRAVDSTPPVVTVDQLNVVAECTGGGGRTMTIAPPAVSDDFDADPAIAVRRDSRTGTLIGFPYFFPAGTTTLHWSATDDSGNTGWSDPQSIRVRDTASPSITGGAPVVVEATSPSGTPYVPRPMSASDACDPSPSVTYTPTAAFALGETTVTFTVRDATGNEASGTRAVRVVDTTAPSFDPPLENVNVGHPGTACFQLTPPPPSVSDNGYAASRLVVSGRRISGPGAPSCWNVGSHVVEWTVTDPAGNSRTGQQTFVFRDSTLLVTARGLEVPGVASPLPLRYYNQPVTVVFDIAQGSAPYQVTLTPRPTSLSNTGNTFRARYEQPGAYPNILVAARDAGTNVGSVYLDGFGIDVTPPSIDAEILPQLAVDLARPATFPLLFRGETASIERIRAWDGATELVNLRRALRFDGGDRVTVPSSSTLDTTQALTLAVWVRAEAFSNAALISKPRQDGDGPGYLLGITAAGRATLELRIGAATVVVTGGALRPRAWQLIAGTYDGRAARLWVDGLPAGQRLASGAVSLGSQPLVIGAEPSGARPFTGQLAEPAVWSAALDEAALTAQWAGGMGRPVPVGATTAALWRLDGTGQVVADATSNANHGILGATAAAEVDDPARTELAYPADGTSSGLVSLSVALVSTANGRRSAVTETSSTPTGTGLRYGARAIGAQRCTAPIGSVCNPGDATLDAELIALWGAAASGSYVLEVTARDAAGNTTTSRAGLRTSDWVGAVRNAIDRVDALAMLPGSIVASNELADARLHLQAAESYATMSSRYLDGSYLRADNAVEALLDAAVLGVDPSPAPDEIARALSGDVGVYVRSLAGTTDARDRFMLTTADRYLVDARFERFAAAPGQVIALGRSAQDSVALLHVPYQRSRAQLRAAQARWAELMGLVGSEMWTPDRARQDAQRLIMVRSMITETRDVLRDVVYRDIEAVLRNPYTTQPQSLREILDVLDKASSSAMDERGDLIAISDFRVSDACLDQLANLDLDDLGFTRCYVRLNDLARFLDRVSEPLVHTYRFRTGVGLALFNMLELSLYVGPQGLPWITSQVPSTMGVELVLPDDEAARVTGAVPISRVDQPDRALGQAYQRYREARSRLEAGDVDAAWAIFVGERCLLPTLYNRYYSSLRAIPNVADPKEAPLPPADIGCSPL